MNQKQHELNCISVANMRESDPTTADARAEVNARVLEAYQQKLAEDPTQAAASPGRNFNLLEDVDPDDPFADLGPEPPFDMGM